LPDNLSVSYSRDKQGVILCCLPLECETHKLFRNVGNHQHRPRNMLQERKTYLHRSGSLISHTFFCMFPGVPQLTTLFLNCIWANLLGNIQCLRLLRFSQQCIWRLRCSGLWLSMFVRKRKQPLPPNFRLNSARLHNTVFFVSSF